MTRFVFSIETRITTAYSWSLVTQWSLVSHSAASCNERGQEAWLGGRK